MTTTASLHTAHVSVCYTEQPSEWSTKDTQTAKDTQSVARRSTCKKGAALKSADTRQKGRAANQASAIRAMRGGQPSTGLIHSEKWLLNKTGERD